MPQGLTLALNIFGGLGLFLFGILTLSKGLRKAAQERLQHLLSRFTRKRLPGFFLGAAVTGVIQSSTATTVMVVGFINADLLTLAGAVPVIFGANVGSTITAQLISFKFDAFALLAVGAGAVCLLFPRHKRVYNTGSILLGLGLLFLGMSTMKEGFAPLRDNPALLHFFTAIGAGWSGRLLAVLAAAAVTALVHSSGATAGVILALCGAGLLPGLESVIPLLVGCHIGTCITAVLVSLGTSADARRAALIHVFFNVFAGALALALLPLYVWAVQSVTGPSLIRQAANAHTLIAVLPALLGLPMTALFLSLARHLVTERPFDSLRRPRYLNLYMLETPEAAFQQCVKELGNITAIARDGFVMAMESFLSATPEKTREAEERREAVELIYKSYKGYLTEISHRDPGVRTTAEFPILFHAAKHLAKVTENAGEIIEHTHKLKERGLGVPAAAAHELREMLELVDLMGRELGAAFERRDGKPAKAAILNKERLDAFKHLYRVNHLERMKRTDIDVRAELVTHDVFIRLERISDHLTHISNEIIGDLKWE
ncbi:MAG: Na/Pi symporter [Fibrobacterota bacterium]